MIFHTIPPPCISDKTALQALWVIFQINPHSDDSQRSLPGNFCIKLGEIFRAILVLRVEEDCCGGSKIRKRDWRAGAGGQDWQPSLQWPGNRSSCFYSNVVTLVNHLRIIFLCDKSRTDRVPLPPSWVICKISSSEIKTFRWQPARQPPGIGRPDSWLQSFPICQSVF